MQRAAGSVCLIALLTGCASSREAPLPSPSLDYTETIRGTTIEFDMVWIEEGGFWIGQTEVTWDEYLIYCAFDTDDPVPPDADAVSKPSKPLETSPYDREWGKGKRPAVGISWNAAKKYCQWLSLNTGDDYRLPTESEWELACGPAPDDLSEHAWFSENSGGKTQEAGQKQPNSHGLYDMLGNLWEYCDNPFSEDRPNRAVSRGGAWNSPADDVTPTKRLGFERLWVLMDPNMPPGVWWVPEGEHLGFRVMRPGPEKNE